MKTSYMDLKHIRMKIRDRCSRFVKHTRLDGNVVHCLSDSVRKRKSYHIRTQIKRLADLLFTKKLLSALMVVN